MLSFSIPHPRMSSAGRRRRATLIAGALATCLASAPAEALTIRDVIELSRAGVGDEVLLALIETERTIFSLDTQHLLELRRAGVSERVVIALVRNGRELVEQPPAAGRPTSPAAPPLESDPTPGLVIIGENPEPRPAAPTVIVVPAPVLVPFFVGVPQLVTPQAGCSPFTAQLPGEGFTGFGRFINDGFVPDSRPIRVWGATPRACAPVLK